MYLYIIENDSNDEVVLVLGRKVVAVADIGEPIAEFLLGQGGKNIGRWRIGKGDGERMFARVIGNRSSVDKWDAKDRFDIFFSLKDRQGFETKNAPSLFPNSRRRLAFEGSSERWFGGFIGLAIEPSFPNDKIQI